MSISVFDESGQQYVIKTDTYEALWQQPLVVEKREICSYPFGDAELVRLIFPGVLIVYGDIRICQSNRLRFEMVNEDQLIEMQFTLSGQGLMLNDIDGRQYQFKANEHNMHYMSDFSGYCHYNPKEKCRFFDVHFSKSFFFELANDASPRLMHFAEKIQNGRMARLCKHNMPMSLAMHQCIQEIMTNKFTGKLKLLFLQSKCVELLALQAQMYEDTVGHSSSGVCKSDFDKDCIYYAKEYLVQNIQQPPSLTELAKIAGINEFKLKQGFRELFNTTVFGYLSDYKLNQARHLLLAEKLPLKEIAERLGYSSVQHFNTAFRKKFGVPPGKVRK
jgi:AraC-type DNA-binding domain-containing proteins